MSITKYGPEPIRLAEITAQHIEIENLWTALAAHSYVSTPAPAVVGFH
jgi:hypothetical protein